MKIPPVTPAAQRLFESLLTLDDRLVRRKMFGQPAAFVGNKLCLGAFGGDVFLRLGPEDVARTLKIRGSRAFEPMPGRAMRAYRILPPAQLSDPSSAKTWVARSVEYTLSLRDSSADR